MFDLGLFTVPAIAAAAVFGVALFSGDTITIDKIAAPTYLELSGITDDVLTRRLTDEIREINQGAASEFESVEMDSTLDKSVGELGGYFQLGQLVTGVRDLFGLDPYYVSGELTGEANDVALTLRVSYSAEKRPSDVVKFSGTAENLHEVIHQAALGVLELVNPYVVALYWRHAELAEGDYGFPRTQVVLDRYLKNRPVAEHYLAYGLLGRMFMIRAEQNHQHPGAITPEQQQAFYDEGRRYLEAALLQKPDFLLGNVNLAVVNAIQGDYAQADVHFTRAVEIDPNYLVARERWAEALEKQGRVREAAFQWVAAVEIKPDDPRLRNELAEDYLILGMFQEARAQIDSAIALDPINATTYQAHMQLMGTSD